MQYQNTEAFKKAKTLGDILDSSFLKPWLFTELTVKINSAETRLCDYAILLDNQLICINYELVSLPDSIQLKNIVAKKQKDILNLTHKHFNKITQDTQIIKDNIYAKESNGAVIPLPESIRLSFILVSKVQVTKNTKAFGVKHHYSSAFYQNNLSSFGDEKPQEQNHDKSHEEQSLIQAISLGNFKKIIHSLCTVTDVVDFLIFHRSVIRSGRQFDNSMKILKAYIASASVFNRARKVDEYLVAKGLRPIPAKTLQKTDPKQQITNFQLIKNSVDVWNHFISSMLQSSMQMVDKNSTAANQLFKALASESIYSRYMLTNCIRDFTRAPEEIQQSGYMLHMRSYNKPKRHYVFLFYAENVNHEHHRAKASAKLPVIAQQINRQEQASLLSEIIVIGLQKNTQGFDMDLHYLKGHAVKPPVQSQKNKASVAKVAVSPNQTSHSGQSVAESGTPKTPVYRTRTNPKLVKHSATPSRNMLCFCGSGKKYRHCHGAIKKQS